MKNILKNINWKKSDNCQKSFQIILSNLTIMIRVLRIAIMNWNKIYSTRRKIKASRRFKNYPLQRKKVLELLRNRRVKNQKFKECEGLRRKKKQEAFQMYKTKSSIKDILKSIATKNKPANKVLEKNLKNHNKTIELTLTFLNQLL